MSIRLALIGVGKIALDQHIPALKKDDQYTLAALVSPDIYEQPELLAELPNAQPFTSFDALLKSNVALDAVVLAAPPQTRYELALSALNNSLDVMLEKPPGRTLQEVAVLQKRALAQGAVLFSAYHSREAAQVDAARHWLEGKHVTGLAIHWKEDVREWHFGQDWVFKPGGLGVFDPGINAFSIASLILPAGFHFTQGEIDIPLNRQTPIAARLSGVLSGYGNNQLTVEFDWLHQGEPLWNIEVVTTSGTLTLTHGGDRLFIDGIEQNTRANAAQYADLQGEYPRLYQHFACLVRDRVMDVDLTSLQLVSDALLVSDIRQTQVFEW